MKYIKMLCSATLPFCDDTKGEYRFLNLSLKEALAKKMDVDQSGFYVSKDTPTATTKPAKKAKAAIKVAKVRKTRKAKTVAAPVVEDTAPASTVLFTNTDEDVEKTAALVAETAEVPTQQKAEDQTDAEFEAEIDASFHEELAKAQVKAQS